MQETIKQNYKGKHKEFAELLSQDLNSRSFKENEIVEGTISKIDERYCFVDIGGKSDGAILLEEFKFAKELDKIAVGSKIKVFLEKIEHPKTGDIILSRTKARLHTSWKKMQESFEQKKPVTGTLVSKVKGGFAVDVSSCLCFCPGSQLSLKPLSNNEINQLMKEPQTFEVVKMDVKRGNIVLSRRQCLEKIRDHDRDKIIEKLKVGAIVDGTVKNITEWGAFIDISGADSLLHVTDVSYSRINKVSDLLSIGQTIKVKITKITDDKKISVSVKDLTEDPYIKEIDKFEIGKNYPATVTKVVDYGAFASLAPGLEGLIHSSEISHTKRNIHPSKILSTSQKINVQILDKDSEKRRISLSYKKTFESPWVAFQKDYKVGDQITGVIKSVTNFGIFFTIKNSELDSLIHYKNLDWNEQPSELEKYKKGQTITAKILEISEEKSKIRCGVRELKPDPFSNMFGKKKVGDVVTVNVQSVFNSGINVSCGSKDLVFTIKKGQLAKEASNQRPSRFTPGQKCDVMITTIDIETRKVTLSIKALEDKEAKEIIEKFGSTESGGVLGDLLKPMLKKKDKKEK